MTKKIDPIRPDFHARLVCHLQDAIEDAEEISGHDIADVLRNLLASARRRQLEALPDITNDAEAA